MASLKARIEAARLAYEDVLDDYTSAWKGKAASIWKSVGKVESGLDTLKLTRDDMSEFKQTAMVWSITVNLWEAVSSTRGLDYFRSIKDDAHLEPTIQDIAEYLRTKIFQHLEHLVCLIKDPMQRKVLENRVDLIWRIIHKITPPAANTPPPPSPSLLVEEAYDATYSTDTTRKSRKRKAQPPR